MIELIDSQTQGLCGSHAQNKKTAFISGKIRNLNFDSVVDKFARKAKELRDQGYKVVNPVERIMLLNFSRKRMGMKPLTDENDIKEIMGICLHDLLMCDELHLLSDWNTSDGAMLERDVALRMRMKIVVH